MGGGEKKISDKSKHKRLRTSKRGKLDPPGGGVCRKKGRDLQKMLVKNAENAVKKTSFLVP